MSFETKLVLLDESLLHQFKPQLNELRTCSFTSKTLREKNTMLLVTESFLNSDNSKT